MKKLMLILIIISLINIINVNAVDDCKISTSCSIFNEKAIFSLYQITDSNVRNDVLGEYKVCCPFNGLKIKGTYGSCGSTDRDDIIVKAYNTGKTPLDAHASIPSSTASGYTQNICLSLDDGVNGSVQCRSASSCDTANNEFGVVSLYQESDSHVGSISDYNNKVCCKVTVCPEGFIWDSVIKTCRSNFPACFVRTVSTNSVDQTEECKDRWMTATSQTGLYWKDALTPLTNDCFEQSSPGIADNARACCYEALYNDKEYGRYSNILINKTIIAGI